MGDVEVRVMIDGLRKRIVDLEREASQEEGRGAAQEERAAKKEMLTKMVRLQFSTFTVYVSCLLAYNRDYFTIGLLQWTLSLVTFTQSYTFIFVCHDMLYRALSSQTHRLTIITPPSPPTPSFPLYVPD